MTRPIPLYLTCLADDEGREEIDETLGRPLNRSMTGFLDDSLTGLTLIQRLDQLAEVYPEAHEAYRLKSHRATLDAISRSLGVSISTAKRLVAKATAFLALGVRGIDPAAPLTYEQRLHMLAATNRAAHDVYTMTSYGWRQDTIAEQLGISVSTVGRLYRRAVETVGAEDRQSLDRLLGLRYSPADVAARAELRADESSVAKADVLTGEI